MESTIVISDDDEETYEEINNGNNNNKCYLTKSHKETTSDSYLNSNDIHKPSLVLVPPLNLNSITNIADDRIGKEVVRNSSDDSLPFLGFVNNSAPKGNQTINNNYHYNDSKKSQAYDLTLDELDAIDEGKQSNSSLLETVGFKEIMGFDLTVEEENTDSLDFQAMKDLMKNSEISASVPLIPRNGSPVCCNSWCSLPGEIIPTDNVRDYFGIPRGSSYRICQTCKQSYDSYSEAALQYFTNGGDMTELQCAYKNDFVVLEDEQASDDVTFSSNEEDKEFEDIITGAIAETISTFENTTKKAIERAKEQVISNFEHFNQAGEQLVTRLHNVEAEMFENLETFRNQFKRKVINLPELDIPIDDEMTIIIEGNDDNDSFPTSNQLAEKYKYSVKAPQVMEIVYSRLHTDTPEWSQFKVIKVDMHSTDSNSSEIFSLEATVGGKVLRKVARSEEIAFCNPPSCQIGVGRRVIAAYNNSGIGNNTKCYLSGMISELPSDMNKYQYLVFFEDGKVQYCPQTDVRLIYKIDKPVYKYFREDLSTMAMEYLCNFPRRKLYYVEVGQRIRVEKNGFWVYCRVERVYASLVLVTYLHNSEVEWLYRGSQRLHPIFNKTKSKEAYNVSRNPQQQPKKLGLNDKGLSFLENQLIDLTNDDDDGYFDDGHLDDMLPHDTTSISATQEPTFPFPYKQGTRSSIKTNNHVITRFPSKMLSPRSFQKHSCSFACVHGVRYDIEKTQGVGPLAIPSIFAFRRTISGGCVKYIAPCGVELSKMQEVLAYLSTTLIPLTLDMFSFSIEINIFDEWVPHPQYIIMKDISLGIENVPIPCYNDIDSEYPALMNYITERMPHEGVFINNDPGFLISCDCKDNCADHSVCSCWKLNYECFSALHIKMIPLTAIGYQYQRLEESIPSGIYECNRNCKCRSTCVNRVAQHPLKNKLQLFKTQKKGWGVRCLNDIPKGTFICTYVANVYTEETANEIGKVRGDEYLTELDHIEVMESSKPDYESDIDSDDSSIDKKEGNVKKCDKFVVDGSTEKQKSLRMFYGSNEGPYILDAKVTGNIGRFFNHSCSPNMIVQNVFVDTHDLRFPWVAYYASKDIPAGSELTWNYGYIVNSVPGKVLFCECGAPNCVKRLL